MGFISTAMCYLGSFTHALKRLSNAYYVLKTVRDSSDARMKRQAQGLSLCSYLLVWGMQKKHKQI